MKYRPGQGNLQFSLFQSLGILIIFNNFECEIFSKIKIQGLQKDQIADFDLLKLPNLILGKNLSFTK